MNIVSSIIIVLLSLSFADGDYSQESKLRAELTKEGFENISIVLEGQRLIVTYENRLYRHEIRAIKKVLSIISSTLEGEMELVLIPQSRAIPLFIISIPPDEIHKPRVKKSYELDSIWDLFQYLLNGRSKEEYNSNIDVNLDLGPALPKISSQHRMNTLFCKCGIALIPQYKAFYGNYPDAIESQINLIPEFNVSFWKGMHLTAQTIIPIQNELSEEENHLRPGLLTINQTVRLPYNIFASATTGYFTINRYGLDLEIKKYFANGRWCLGSNLGYTGHAEYSKGLWRYSPLGVFTALFNMEYNIPQFDLHLQGTYGWFISQDRGWRFDLFRQYGEAHIGFYSLRTIKNNKYWDAGFYFRVPIFPSRRLSIGSLRIGPADEFSQEYHYHGYQGAGSIYQTGNSIARFMKHLSPSYIKNQVLP